MTRCLGQPWTVTTLFFRNLVKELVVFAIHANAHRFAHAFASNLRSVLDDRVPVPSVLRQSHESGRSETYGFREFALAVVECPKRLGFEFEGGGNVQAIESSETKPRSVTTTQVSTEIESSLR